jgi:hypothetical protein
VAGGQGSVVRRESAQDALRHAFLAWQCRVRQIAIRDHGGRPTPGMRPVLEVATQRVGPITVVLNKGDGGETTTQFRFLVKKTHDPLERYEAAMRHLAAAYYQKPDSFSDQMTALFAPEAGLPGQIAGRDDCRLLFEQFRQRWRLPCTARLLDPSTPSWQATYWHNALFNEHLPSGVQIVAFAPDWSRVEAEPSPI